MVSRDHNSDDAMFDDSDWWSGDSHPLERMLEFVAPGSRLVYEYHTTARIGGIVNCFHIAPVIGVARYADHHVYITGIHFLSGDKKCLLDFDELVGLLKLLDRWLAPKVCQPVQPDHPTVKIMRYETRNGLVIESFADSKLGDVARVSVASPVTVLLRGAELEHLFRVCQEAKVFLDKFRE